MVEEPISTMVRMSTCSGVSCPSVVTRKVCPGRPIIEKRLDLASQADLALAFYNPISRSRPWQLGRAPEPVAEAAPVEEEEEIDPLDAFMTNITNTVAEVTSKDNDRAQVEEELLGDDEVDLVANEQEPEDILALAAKMKKKKDLPTINHAKMNYEPFRKSFYVEPLELKEMTEEEVDGLRLELDGIKIRGQDAQKPVQKWRQCGLPSQSLSVDRKSVV